jgi:molecular chaperone GrpE
VPRATGFRSSARRAIRVDTRDQFAPAPLVPPADPSPPHAALDEQGDELDDEENNRRTAEAEVEVVEDEDDEEEEEAEEAAPPTRVSEIMARLQEAVDAGTGGDVLAELLPELTTEVTGIESAFKDIQAANVGLEDQAAAVKDQFLRLTADFDNFKKRTVKEKQQLGETAKSKVFEAMLPALDNFDLAKANLKPESEEGEKIMNQYQGLYEGLMTILSNQGLTAVDGVGAPFDPNFHEAIMREESEEPEDVIIEEFRKGYKMGEDTLVRASMVKVSAGPASE